MFNWFQRSSKSPRRRPPTLPASTPAPAIPLPAADPAALARLPAAARELSPQAQRVLASLPASVDLARSCAGFPVVVERLLGQWRDPRSFRATLDSMLMDSRGGRQGFPFDVVSELGALRHYYDSAVFPVASAGWGSIDPR